MDTKAGTVKSVNDVENFMLMEKYASHLSGFMSFTFCLMSKNRYAAGRNSVRTECLRAGRDARRDRPSDGTGAGRARDQGVVLAEDSVLEDEDGSRARREGAEDDQAPPDALLLRWIRTELHGQSLHTSPVRRRHAATNYPVVEVFIYFFHTPRNVHE